MGFTDGRLGVWFPDRGRHKARLGHRVTLRVKLIAKGKAQTWAGLRVRDRFRVGLRLGYG